MAAVLTVAKGVPCRACGAVLAHPGRNKFDICGNCWTQVILHCSGTVDLRRRRQSKLSNPSTFTEEDVNSWLAHKLVKDIRRLTRTGIVGRCEAMSGWSSGNPGTQCACAATEHRDGHKVCGRHAKATAPVYVTDEQTDHYQMLSGIIRHLASVDVRFAQAVREAL